MPELGRWNVIDQLAEQYHSASPYAYVLNKPIMMVDPDGRKVAPIEDIESNQPVGSLWGYYAGGGRSAFGSIEEYTGAYNPLMRLMSGERYNPGGSGDGSGSSGGTGNSNAVIYRMISLGGFWTNQGYGFSSSDNIAIDYSGKYLSLNTQLDGWINIPEVALTGNKSTWGQQIQSQFNAYMNEWNAQQNLWAAQSRLNYAVANTKVGQSITAFENFVFKEIPMDLAIGELAALGWAASGAGKVIGNTLSKLTTADGFLIKGFNIKLPFDLKVGLYASENTFQYGTFKWSTIAPKFLTKYQWFGRNALQITSEFQPQLGKWVSQTIPKGTNIRIGLVGQQAGNSLGTWLQIYAPSGVPFIP